MAPFSQTGWLPIDIHLEAEPQIVGTASVRWLEFGSTKLEEPFFGHTVTKLKEANPPAREVETDLETLFRLGSRLPAVRPAGFIFHVSHCGSTLIANALRLSGEVVLVSEPNAITRPLLPFPPQAGAYMNARWSDRRRAMLESVLALFATYRTGEPEQLLIKFTSIDILGLPVIRALWPEVPCLIVTRDPSEVIVASAPGVGWMSWKNSGRAADIFGWPASTRAASEMTNEEFCARVLGRFFRSATECFDDKCMAVDYEDLKPDRMRQIAAFFNIELPAEEEPLNAIFKVYSKDPQRKMGFQHDRARKQRQASGVVRSAAQQWAMRSYGELRGR